MSDSIEFALAPFPGMESFVFSGKTYRIFLCKSDEGDGYCEPPDTPDALLWINIEAEGSRLLRAAVHEAIHAEMWSLAHDDVQRIGDEVADFVTNVFEGIHGARQRRAAKELADIKANELKLAMQLIAKIHDFDGTRFLCTWCHNKSLDDSMISHDDNCPVGIALARK